MIRLLCLAVFFALAACATAPEPKVRTVEVRVPVRVACVTAEVPHPPTSYADDKAKAAPDAAERYRLIATANEQRKARLAIAEPVLAGCR
jgi:hypothetical protein